MTVVNGNESFARTRTGGGAASSGFKRASDVASTEKPVSKTKLEGPDAEGLIGWVTGDDRRREFCASAVDPLEVAARLETFGLSARVVKSKFGFANVFDAADVVYHAIPYSDVRPALKEGPRMGRPVDLMRGALYAIPALFFSVIIINFGLGAYWWLLPVGLTISWGTGQGFTVLSWTMRDHKDQRSDSLIAAVSVVTTAVLCFVVALITRAFLGGSMTCVVVTAALGIYIASSGVLMFHSAERLLILCLTPALVGTVLSLGVISTRAAAWCVIASAALVVVCSLGPLTSSCWRVPTISRETRVQVGKFVVYGLGCGLLTSAVIDFGTHGAGATRAMAVASGPLLVTLGLMEWQLRTFRSLAIGALTKATDVEQFTRRARGALMRSLVIYVGALVVVSVIALVVSLVSNFALAPLLIVTIDALGVAFFFALIFVSAGLIDRVLLTWGLAFGVLVATMALAWATTGHLANDVGVLSVLLAAVAAVASLSVQSRTTLRSPLTYEVQT